jgi:hypothetical protein
VLSPRRYRAIEFVAERSCDAGNRHDPDVANAIARREAARGSKQSWRSGIQPLDTVGRRLLDMVDVAGRGV